MTRGIVLWPDPDTSVAVRGMWQELASAGLPSMATHTHRRHQPHVSLVVAESLDAPAAGTAVGLVTATPLPCRLELAAFFPGGVLMLPLVPSYELLLEQQRVSSAIDGLGGLMVGRSAHTKPGVWAPHMTCAYGIAFHQVAAALEIALGYLPITGYLTRGGIEDGATGENWPSSISP